MNQIYKFKFDYFKCFIAFTDELIPENNKSFFDDTLHEVNTFKSNF